MANNDWWLDPNSYGPVNPNNDYGVGVPGYGDVYGPPNPNTPPPTGYDSGGGYTPPPSYGVTGDVYGPPAPAPQQDFAGGYAPGAWNDPWQNVNPFPAAAPDWFAPADTWLGKQERNLATAPNPIEATGIPTLLRGVWGLADAGLNQIGVDLPDWKGPQNMGVLGAVGDVFNLGAQAVQEGVGNVMQDMPGARYGIDGKGVPNLLDPTTAMRMGAGYGLQAAKGFAATPAQKQAVEDIQTKLGYGDTLRETAQGLYDQAKREGWLNVQTPANLDPVQHVLDTVNQLTWSSMGTDPKDSPAAKAIRRILAGENPDTAVNGAQQPEANAFADQWGDWNGRVKAHIDSEARLAYADGLAEWRRNPMAGFMGDGTRLTAEQFAQARAEAAQKDAAQKVTGTKQIGSEQDVLKQLAYSVVFDPLSALNVGEAIPVVGKLLGKAKGTAQAAGLAADAVVDVERAAEEVARLTKGVAPLGELSGNPVVRAIQEVKGKAQRLFEFTPETQARVTSGIAWRQVAGIASEAETPAETVARLRQFVENPKALVDVMGNVQLSVEAEAARPVLKEALPALEKLAMRQAQSGRFDPAEWAVGMSEALLEAGKKVAKVDPAAKASGLQTLKQWMGEFYLRTPGYLIRNAVSDTLIAQTDGLRMFERMDDVRKGLDKFGLTTRRAASGAGGLLEEMAPASKLSNVPIVGAWQNKMGELATKGEQARYQRALWSAIQDSWAAHWQPQLGEQTLALFEKYGLGELADSLGGALNGAKSGKDVTRIVNEFVNASTPAEQFHASQYLSDMRDLAPEFQAALEAELRTMAQGGAKAEDVAAYFERQMQAVRDHAAKAAGLTGDPLSARAVTEKAFEQDVAEFMQRQQSALASLVNHGAMTKEEAVAQASEELARYTAQAKEMQQARQGLREAYAAAAQPGTGGSGLGTGAIDAITHAIAYEEESRAPVRLAIDAQYQKLMRDKANRGAWEEYRAWKNGQWDAHLQQVTAEYGKVGQALGELRGAQSAEAAAAILERYGIESLDGRLEKALAVSRERLLNATHPRPLPKGGVDATAFDQGIQSLRYGYDQAQVNAARKAAATIGANPELSTDVFDVLVAAQGDASTRFTQALGRQTSWLAEYQNGQRTFEAYNKATAEEWQKAFGFVTERFNAGVDVQLRKLELSRSLIAKDLKDLGWDGPELARLVNGMSDGSTRAEVEQIVNLRRPPARAGAGGLGMGAGASTGSAPAVNPLSAPQDVGQWIGERPLDEALAEAQKLRDAADELTGGSTQLAQLEATREQLPDKRLINQWLKPNGEPKTMDGRSWVDAPFNRVDVVAQEYFGATRGANTYGADVMGGQLEAFYNELKRAQDADRQIAALKAGGKKALSAEGNAASTAVERWDAVVKEIEDRMAFAAGESEQASAMRELVRDSIKQRGLAETAYDIKNTWGAGPTPDAITGAMADEFRQTVRGRIERALDSGGDLGKAYSEAVGTLREAMGFGVNAEGRMDIGQAVNELNQYAIYKQVPGLRGLEREANVELIRHMAQDLGMADAAAAWTKGERTASEVLAQAEQANAPLVADLLRADVVRTDGRVKAEQWKYLAESYGLEGQRRAPGDVLRELAPKPITNAHPLPLPEGGGNAVDGVATSGVLRQAQDERGAAMWEAVAKRDRVAEQMGNADAPLVIDLLTAHEKKQLEALAAIRDGIVGKWDGGVTALPSEIKAALQSDTQKLGAQLFEARARAVAEAEARANFAMLDYGQKRNIDTILGAVAPYYYWGSRQGRNFAIRIAERPGIALTYLKYKTAMEDVNAQRGYRQRFEGGWEIPLPLVATQALGMPQGTSAMVDPVSLLFPFANIVKLGDANANERRSGAAQLYSMLDQVGLRPAPWWDVPIRMSNMLVNAQPGTPEYEQQVADVGSKSVGSLLPQTGMVKGATALLNMGPPGGMDAESALRGGAAGRFEAYDVARSIRDMATERLPNGAPIELSGPYLVAQAMVALRQAQGGGPSTSSGQASTGSGWQDLLTTATPEQLAAELNVPLGEATQALRIVREAAARSGRQAGVQSLASGLLGLNVKLLPTGERMAQEQMAKERGAGYSATSGYGSRADMLAVRKMFPALAVGRAQYGTLPGESETQAMDIWRGGQREALNTAFDAVKDKAIAQQPWTKKPGQRVEDARQAALATLEPKPSGAGKDWRDVLRTGAPADEAVGGTMKPYYPRSIAGATPAEAKRIRQEEVVQQLARTAPAFDSFKNASGQVDYEAYAAAREQWLGQVPALVASDQRVGDVLDQAKKDGIDLGQFARSVTGAMIENYWRRNDSPLEAMQRTYFEKVYQPALDAYDARKAAGEKDLNTAYAETVGKVGTMGMAQLVGLVKQAYPNRWTDAELGKALAGMAMPSAKDVQRANMSASARASAERSDAIAKQKADAAARVRALQAEFENGIKKGLGEDAWKQWNYYRFADTSTKQKMARTSTIKWVKDQLAKFEKLRGVKSLY